MMTFVLLSNQQSAFSYDNEGQLAGVNSDVYTFDYEHRLTTAAVSGQQSAFSYDGKGNRLKAVRNGVTTYYIYDMNGNVLAEADVNKVITKLYIQGQGLLAMVTPIDQVYSYHFNAIGSTVAITDQSENVVNKYAYNVFGKVLNEVETVPQPFKYVGQYGVMAESCELTAECFLYMRARYYDPKVGRFISEDPIGFAGGTVNLYEYVGNNPVNFTDSKGLSIDSIDFTVDLTIVGAGESIVTCCDKNNKKHRATYHKICYGLSVGATAASFGAPITNGECPPQNGWSNEVGVAGSGFDYLILMAAVRGTLRADR